MIITADVHLHTFKAFADKKSEMNSRLKNTLAVLEQILAYAVANNDKTIILVGDSFETKNMVEAVTNNHFADWVAKCKENSIKVIILVGNHDISSLGDERVTLLHPLKYFENVTLINEPTVLPFFGGTLSFVPFRRNQDVVREMINRVVDVSKQMNASSVDQQINFLFYHGAVMGAKISNREFIDNAAAVSAEDLRIDYFDQVFLGHFHKHQKVAENARYVGSPLHHDLHDAGDKKGFYHYDEKENRLKFVKTHYPSFVKVEIETEEDWTRQEFNDFDYFVINVNEDVKVAPKFYSMTNVKIHKATKRSKTQRLEVEYKANEKMDSDKLITNYVNHLKDQNKLDSEKLIALGKELLHA